MCKRFLKEPELGVWFGRGQGTRKTTTWVLDLRRGRRQSNKSGKIHTGPHDAKEPRVVMLPEETVASPWQGKKQRKPSDHRQERSTEPLSRRLPPVPPSDTSDPTLNPEHLQRTRNFTKSLILLIFKYIKYFTEIHGTPPTLTPTVVTL